MVALWLVESRLHVHRRVESVSFLDTGAFRRKASVDFGLEGLPRFPPDPSLWLVPITVLQKRPLTDLDVIDETGRPLSVLNTAENGALASAVLIESAAALAGAPADHELAELLEKIARSPTEDAEFARLSMISRLQELPVSDPLAKLATDDVFLGLCQSLSENFVFAVLLGNDGPLRRILKFSYVEEIEEAAGRGLWDRVARSLAWRPRLFTFDTPAAHTTESFHFEVTVPDGVAISEALIAGSLVTPVSHANPAGDLRAANLPPGGVARVHLHAPPTRDASAGVLVAIRVARGGWLRTALIETFAVAAFMFASSWRLPALLDLAARPNRVNTDVAALLMAIVALLVALVVRAGEHPLTSRFVTAVRLVTVASALLPLAGAWLLAFGPSEEQRLTDLWWALAFASLIPATVALAAYGRANLVTPTSYDSDED